MIYLSYHSQLYIIGIYFLVVCVVAIAMISLSYFLAPRFPYDDKLEGYECGFAPFGDARMQFDIHYYVIGLLFLIFDLEVVLVLPWSLNGEKCGIESYANICIFLILLTIGFLYEWFKGALDIFEPIFKN